MRKNIIIERLQSALIGTLFIAVFLPFGLNNFDAMRWPLLAGIGAIIALSVLASELIVEHLFKMPNDISRGSKFIIKRNLFFEAFNIVLQVLLVMLFLDTFACNDIVDNHFGWATFGSAIAVSIYVTIIIHLYWRNVYKKRYLIKQLEEMQLLNGIMLERQRTMTEKKNETGVEDKPADAGRMVINGTTKEHLDIMPSQFIYATSEGNYLHIHYLRDGKHFDMMIRTSMKNAVETLCCHASIMQCHRAYVVNLLMVERIESRNSGIALIMAHCGDVVLVSKQYSAEVKEKIQNPQ